MDLGGVDITEPSQFYEQYHGSVQNKRTSIPKRIDIWTYNELKKQLTNEIDYLKQEISKRDDIIARIYNPVQEVRNIIPPEQQHPIRRYVNPAKMLAQMEDLERRKYWDEEIKKRDELVKTTGNVSDVGTINEKENTGTATN